MKKLMAPAAKAANGLGACLTIKLPKFSFYYFDGELPSKTKRYAKNKAHQTALKYNLGKADEEDLLQEIYRSLYNRAQDFDETRGASLETFLHLCVDGAARDFIRGLGRMKNKKLHLVLDIPLDKFSDDDPDSKGECLIDRVPSEAADRAWKVAELKNDVDAVIGRLDPDLRRVCTLLKAGYSISAVAKALGCDRQIVRRHILPKLKEAFAEFL